MVQLRRLERQGAYQASIAKSFVVLGFYLVHALVAGVRATPVGAQMLDSSPGQYRGEHEPPADRPMLHKLLDLCAVMMLVLLGGIFAGLTLGLMGLDMVNLQVLSSSGSEEERKNALTVLRLLERGRHWVLVVLLLGNVIVNETLPVFLSGFGSGLSAVILSTVLIVIFGEIVPQSVCARYGLTIGAKCAPLVHVAMIVLAPIAYPTAKVLDWCLGEEHGTTYRKAELKTFVQLHQQIGTETLNDDEVTIIRAVLDLNDKTLEDVMTPIEDVFTLPSNHILDEQAVAELVQLGYSRVPVHEPGRPDAILGMLLVKKLIQYDPEDGWPVSRFTLTPLPEASADLNLLDAINYMQVGRSHMILVSRHPGEPTGALGVVTLEDIIEEMIGEEIVDETDVFVDVHNKVKVVRGKPPSSNSEEQWQPLIRSIIERRRKHGGPTLTPLHNSFGTVTAEGRRNAKQNKYGLIPATKALDKVSIKRPHSALAVHNRSLPNSSPRLSDLFSEGQAHERSNLASSSESYGAFSETLGRGHNRHYSDASRRRDSVATTTGEETDAEGANEPYIIEMGGSNGQIPRVITVADIGRDAQSDERALSAAAAAVHHRNTSS